VIRECKIEHAQYPLRGQASTDLVCRDSPRRVRVLESAARDLRQGKEPRDAMVGHESRQPQTSTAGDLGIRDSKLHLEEVVEGLVGVGRRHPRAEVLSADLVNSHELSPIFGDQRSE
jgi:hypothetical protein